MTAGGPAPVFADSTANGVLTYSLSGNNATITDCAESAKTEEVTAAFAEIADKNYTVTNIGGSAFLNCRSLTSVSIPTGVISIGSGPFRNCSSLTEINVDPENRIFMSDAGILFDKMRTTIIQFPAGNGLGTVN